MNVTQADESSKKEYAPFAIKNGAARISESEIKIRQANMTLDKALILELRDIVYVSEQGRIGHIDDMQDTFDKYDAHAMYMIAYQGERSVGTVKVIADSFHGLPCEVAVNLERQRSHGVVVEFGHLITRPDVRTKGIGLALMRAAFKYSLATLNARYIMGDLFVDRTSTGLIHEFYRSAGFQTVGEPYQDVRFSNSPPSQVVQLDVEEILITWKDSTGSQRRLLDYFLSEKAE